MTRSNGHAPTSIHLHLKAQRFRSFGAYDRGYRSGYAERTGPEKKGSTWSETSTVIERGGCWPGRRLKVTEPTPLSAERLLTAEELDTIRIAGAAWCNEVTFDAIFDHYEGLVAELQREIERVTERKDGAYLERNQVVQALSKCFPAGVARTAIEGWSEDWHGCVYIDLPTGQVSWHFHDSQANLFEHLPPYTKPWDGHTTEEKYERLAALKPGEIEGYRQALEKACPSDGIWVYNDCATSRESEYECAWCGGWREKRVKRMGEEKTIYGHEADCAWVEARRVLAGRAVKGEQP